MNHRYESLALLLCYGAYVGFMKFNAQAEQWVKSKIGSNDTAPQVKVYPFNSFYGNTNLPNFQVYPLPEGQTVNTLDRPAQPAAAADQKLPQAQSIDSGSSQCTENG